VLRTQDLPPGSVVQIVEVSGTVIARSIDGANWIGRNLREDPVVARHLAMTEAIEVSRWADNIERITGSTSAGRVPWLVCVGLSSDVVLANVTSRLVWSTGASLTALLIVLGLAWAFSTRIIRPLRQLSHDASALASGDMSHRTAICSRDEVGALAGRFNSMATSLETRHRELHEAREAAATEAVKRASSEETLAAVIDASPVAIVCSDPERRIFLWSRAAEEIFGYPAEEATGQLAHLMPPKQKDESQNVFNRALGGETLQNVRMKRLRKDGTAVDVRIAAAPMYNPDGTVRGVARAYEDITEYARAEQQLERLAHYDQLTGLPNRVSLQKELGRLLSGDCIRPTAIALFDLDGFKDVNDTLGHSIGDQLLIEVGHRLGDMAGGRGQVCRLGGDEFVVILPGCGDPLAIGEIIEAMLLRLAEPYRISDQILHIAGSAGVAIAPGDGSTADELIANADLALYKAKSDGGRTCHFFLPVLRARAQAHRSLDLELRRAYAESEFELHFQPQIRLADEAVVGAEALIRWRHPERGILAPGAFIDTLAASSIAPVVSQWTIRTACAMTAQWRAAGLPLGRIAVNLFPSQVGDEALLRDIDEALKTTELPAHALELEITENVALNFEDAVALRKLHENGVKLAFDDFGTGYASLSYLTRFPLARIKIDRTFVGKVTDDAGDAAIVRSLIAMAHNLGLEVIAEGVETEAQAAFLLNEQCEEAQGYLYAKPLPAADFEAYLKTRRLAFEEAEKRLGRHTRFQRRAGKAPDRRRFPAA
jgi:diguanylate cyclase (GGDEF)-like protein/PAS domain S-box-containing protein